jgi:hypothetical protein
VKQHFRGRGYLPGVSVHVAVLKRPYIVMVLAGQKTVESRLSKTACAPFGQVVAGERLFIKASGGPFMAMATAARVDTFEGLTPGRVDALRERYEPAVGGDDAYWHGKRSASFATMITLAQAEPMDVGPAFKPAYMKAWYVLDDAASPLREVTLTGGAIRNNYLVLPGVSATRRESGLTLVLPDGASVETGFAKGDMLRWRGWGAWYRAWDAQEGDVVRLVALGGGRYRVGFRRGSG